MRKFDDKNPPSQCLQILNSGHLMVWVVLSHSILSPPCSVLAVVETTGDPGHAEKLRVAGEEGQLMTQSSSLLPLAGSGETEPSCYVVVTR